MTQQEWSGLFPFQFGSVVERKAHHSQPNLGTQGLPGVRRRGGAKPSAYYDSVVDVMEKLVKFTLLRNSQGFLADRYSERMESA